MKKLLLAILALTLTSGAMAQNKTEKITLYVNYHCGSCVQKVDKNIKHEKGVKNFKTNLNGKSIEITYNPKQTNPDKLRKAIEKMDFVVKDSYSEILKHPGKH
ncbi:MAG: heavy-metal-associated domain-containing protein [Bacteroidales bacterium]|jgi:copper chaperone CopZ|nr:heavy-metal-associated domain-containing protein [Bacteroidales bacterium]